MALFGRFFNGLQLCKSNFSTQRVCNAVEKMLAASRSGQPVDRSSFTQIIDAGDHHSEQQLQIVKLAMPHIETGLDAHSADLPDHGAPLLLADFGSSHGSHSSYAMSAIIKFFRQKYGVERTSTILVIHEDMPKNNWGQLFNFVHSDPRTYLKEHQGVYALASAKGFHRQCLPNHSLFYGFSSAHMQVLSKIPVKLENHCLPQHGSEKEREAYRKQAAEDWKAIVTARSKELVKGGVFVTHVFTGGKGTLMDGSAGDLLYSAVTRLVKDKVITREEQLDFNIPVYFRTKEEVTDEKLFDSLELELISAEYAKPMPIAIYQQYKKHNKREILQRDFSLMVMDLIEPAFIGALSHSRSTEDKAAIFKKLADYYTTELSKMEVDKFNWGREHLFLVLKKIDPAVKAYYQ